MKRDYCRANPNTPNRDDRFHLETRRVKDFRIKVTMWESRGDSTGGPLEKTTATFDDMDAVLDLLDETDRALEADGWERWFEPLPARIRARFPDA